MNHALLHVLALVWFVLAVLGYGLAMVWAVA